MSFQRPTKSAPQFGSRELAAAAGSFLASSQINAIEPSHQAHVMALADAYSKPGASDATGLQAAFSTSERQAPVRGQKHVAVLSLVGVLTPDQSLFTMLGMGTSLRAFSAQLAEATVDSSIRAIAVVIDSPGGLVGMAQEVAAQMRAARAAKPVLALVQGMNASAAYWITANASSIEATPSALVGSIGVYGVRASIAKQLEREGVDIEVFSAGRFKTEGLPVLPVTEDERRHQRAHVEETYGQFVNDVAAGRRVGPAIVRGGYGEGRVVSAKEAARLGMIDRVCALEDSLARMTSPSGARALASTEDDELRRRLEAY